MGCADSKERVSRPENGADKTATPQQPQQQPSSLLARPQSLTSSTPPQDTLQEQQQQQSGTASLKARRPGPSSSTGGSSRVFLGEEAEEGSIHGGEGSGGRLAAAADLKLTPPRSATRGGGADHVPPNACSTSSSTTLAAAVQDSAELTPSCSPLCPAGQGEAAPSASMSPRQQASSADRIQRNSTRTAPTASLRGSAEGMYGADDGAAVTMGSTARVDHKPPPSSAHDGPLVLESTLPQHDTPPPPLPLGSRGASPSSPALRSPSPPPPSGELSSTEAAPAVPRELRWGSSGSAFMMGTLGDTTTTLNSLQHTAVSTQPPSTGASRSSSCQPAPVQQQHTTTQTLYPQATHHRPPALLPSSARATAATAAPSPAQCSARLAYNTAPSVPLSSQSSSTAMQPMPRRPHFAADNASGPLESPSSVSSFTTTVAAQTTAGSPGSRRPSTPGQLRHSSPASRTPPHANALPQEAMPQRASPSAASPRTPAPMAPATSSSPAPIAAPSSLDAPSDLPLPEHITDLPFGFPLYGVGAMVPVTSVSGSGGGAPRTPPRLGMLSHAAPPRGSPTHASLGAAPEGFDSIPAEPSLISPHKWRAQPPFLTTSGNWLLNSLTSNDNGVLVARGGAADGGGVGGGAAALDGSQPNTPPTNSELVRQIRQPATHVKSILRKSGSVTTNATMTIDTDPSNTTVHSRVLSLSVNGAGGAGAAGGGGGEGTGLAASPRQPSGGGTEGRLSGPASLAEVTLRTDFIVLRSTASELEVGNGGGVNASTVALSAGSPSPRGQRSPMCRGSPSSGSGPHPQQGSSGSAGAGRGSGTSPRFGPPITLLPHPQSRSPRHGGSSTGTTVVGGASSTFVTVPGEGISPVGTPSATAASAAATPRPMPRSPSAPLPGFKSPAPPHRSASASGGGGQRPGSLRSSAKQSQNNGSTPVQTVESSTQLSLEGPHAVSCTSDEPPPDIMLATPPTKRVHVVV